jgi:cytoskeletal protein CcmA (bactofilin family)
MTRSEIRKKDSRTVIFGSCTSFSGYLKFSEVVCIQGKFKGTIDAAAGELIVDKGALVETDRIAVSSLAVYGSVAGTINAKDKVDMLGGAEVKGDVTTARLRIADGVLFEGQCSMTGIDKDVEIFSRPTEEIKAELQRVNG